MEIEVKPHAAKFFKKYFPLLSIAGAASIHIFSYVFNIDRNFWTLIDPFFAGNLVFNFLLYLTFSFFVGRFFPRPTPTGGPLSELFAPGRKFGGQDGSLTRTSPGCERDQTHQYDKSRFHSSSPPRLPSGGGYISAGRARMQMGGPEPARRLIVTRTIVRSRLRPSVSTLYAGRTDYLP